MSGQDLIEVIGVLIVAFVLGVIIPLTITFTFVKHRGGHEDLYTLANQIRAGKAELLPWTATSLSELTAEWIGWTTYTVSMFGRNDQVAGHVPSTKSPEGWLLAFCADSRKDGTDGKVLAVTSTHRLELSMNGRTFDVQVNGAALGTLKLGEGGEISLVAPGGAQMGTFRRQVEGGQLMLNGKEAATLARSTNSETRTSTMPLMTLSAERTPQDEQWILALVVVQLAWVGPGVGGAA